MPSAPSPSRQRGQAACPACGAPAQAAHMPFCSQGCRDRDLLKWLSEGHRIPGPPADDEVADFDREGMDREAPPSL
ncbi:DNA gyrase inhibitor YacG [Sphingomonas nostoxanthinifaciens]|nr:DNA gyrase inhibitor YacG [Sphingomonas nostoxanthinifaciens]UAK24501.1 DNA gyrase inhibitor YacG [Sphingomonas nostoxanthinifaciens]